MIIKQHRRVVPTSRANQKDNFRVEYGNRADFDLLKVTITSKADQREQIFYFERAQLPIRDSIHFSTDFTDGRLNVRWRGITPSLVTPPVVMRLEPAWFQVGYYVYIVHILYQRQSYFYIGMTGDRKHAVARSPFYRMSGHFNKQESSTENHIIKGLRKNLGATPVLIDQMLGNSTVTYYSYLVQPVSEKMDGHTEKRRYAESVESALILLMKTQFGSESVFNERISRRDNERGSIAAAQIFQDLQQRMQTGKQKRSV